MSKQWYEGMSEQHQKVWNDAASVQEKGDCAVKAVAIAAGWEYNEAHAALKKLGRVDRKGTKKGLVESVLILAGYCVTEIPTRRVAAKTVTTIERDNLFKHGTYIVRTSGHVLCVIDGKPIDWTNGRRHRIKSVYQVEPLNVTDELKKEAVGCLDTAVKVEVADTSHCTRCGCDKPVVAFSRDKSRKNGLDTWCKLCTKEHRQLRNK